MTIPKASRDPHRHGASQQEDAPKRRKSPAVDLLDLRAALRVLADPKSPGPLDTKSRVGLLEEFPAEDPLARGRLVTAARINLYYPPELGKSRSNVITVEVTRRGRLNLHKFDAALQAKLECSLVDLGILAPGQTLTTQEAPPETGMANPQPVYEG